MTMSSDTFCSFINSKAMKTNPVSVLLWVQISEVCAEFRHLTEGQTLGLSCTPQQGRGPLRGLHLYHVRAQAQTTLLSVAEGGAVRVDPERGARLQLSGGLTSAGVNVSMSHLQPSDSGLYEWELSYRETNGSDETVLSGHKTLLLVEGAGRTCRCSHRHIQLLQTISAAAGLLLLAFSWMILEQCVKARHLPTPQPHSPIYQEMKWKETTGGPQNNREAPSQMEEVSFPVYSNSDVTQQPQEDSHYACPRKLTLWDHV